MLQNEFYKTLATPRTRFQKEINRRTKVEFIASQRETEGTLGDIQTYTLNKIISTAAEHETYRAAHSTWGSITYSVS